MLKASALYMVVIIALVIAVFCASLIATAYYYRLESQKNVRAARLEMNLQSGMGLLLSSGYSREEEEWTIDLFEEQTDSISLKKELWGIFELAAVKAFTKGDTLKKVFLIGEERAADQTAIYLSDEDRPLSVSGSTRITGNAVLPKAGIKQAYVEGKPYDGKELVKGDIKDSERQLPALSADLLERLRKQLTSTEGGPIAPVDSLTHSFFHSPLMLKVDASAPGLKGGLIAGKVMIWSDTVLTIEGNMALKDVLVLAPAIIVKEGFKGNCQLFARDSIVAEKGTVFEYPSAMGILKQEGGSNQPRISLGEECRFSGVLFSSEPARSDLQTVISLGKNSYVKGEVYASGFVKMEKPLTIEGKVSCNRFIIQTPTTLYENYLLDIIINRSKRSPYYLSSPLFNQGKPKQILKWLN